jgi:quercetin dioxygenase-like cupin family protein
MDPKVYYDYERPFITMKQDRDRMAMLPRVIKPALFAKGGNVLGDVRVFERFTVGPVSSLTGSFLQLEAGGRTDLKRSLPTVLAYVLEGSGEVIQDGTAHAFVADDLIVVPPYTAFQIVADRRAAVRAWLPQVRVWHLMGLLWEEQLELSHAPDGTEPMTDANGELTGFRVPAGTLGLERDLDVRVGADPVREAFFRDKRDVRQDTFGQTAYERYFLRQLVADNAREEHTPRVIRSTDTPWEDTRFGRLRFYISNWTEMAGRSLDVMALQVEPGGHSGKHLHIFEEMLLVRRGRGHDLHGETRHAWEAGDIICVPPMTEHQHCNDGDDTAELLSVWPNYLTTELLGGIHHIEDASSWRPR